MVAEDKAYSPGDYSPSRRKNDTQTTSSDLCPPVITARKNNARFPVKTQQRLPPLISVTVLAVDGSLICVGNNSRDSRLHFL